MTKTDLILQWETTKLLVDKEMHEDGIKTKKEIQSELSRAISLFIGDIKKLDLQEHKTKALNLAVSESDETPEYMDWWYSISDCHTTDLFMKYKLPKPPTEARIKEVYEKEVGHYR